MLKNVWFWFVNTFNTISTSDLISLFTLITIIIGGFFALHKWKESIINQRSEMIKALIEKIRDDKEIYLVMDIIDWNEDFKYNGKFVLEKESSRMALKKVDDSSLFRMIDKTLSHFSYICYLKKKKLIKKSDIKIFDYEIRRLFDNKHICNYLYSLYHWSKHLKVSMPFEYLVKYGVKKRFLHLDFYRQKSKHYFCYLIF